MNKTEYTENLLSIFDYAKQMIKEGAYEPILTTDNTDKTEKLFFPKDGKAIKLYSISTKYILSKRYIHLSGVNVLFYLVCLYIKDVLNDKGCYCSNPELKLNILKKSSFIYEEDENGFWYFPVSEIKEKGAKEGFIFDLPKLPTSVGFEHSKRRN